MNGDAFRAALDELGHTQASFARLLHRLMGSPASPTAASVARDARRWAAVGAPPLVSVVVFLLSAGGGASAVAQVEAGTARVDPERPWLLRPWKEQFNG